MKKRLMRAMLLMALCVALVTSGLVLSRMYVALRQQVFGELKNVVGAINILMQGSGDDEAALQALTHASKATKDIRFTWIDKDGNVLFDSAVGATQEMDSHLNREEIVKAVGQGEGQASRLSQSLGENTYYHAKRLADGSVLRAARTRRSLLAEIAGLVPSLALIVAGVFVLAALMIRRFSQKLLEPIRQLDLEKPLSAETYEELAPLLARILQQGKDIEKQRRLSEENAQKVAAITGSMSEGLVMLSADGKVLTLNHSAEDILTANEKEYIGKPYLRLLRDVTIQETVDQALRGEKAETEMLLRGKIYQLLASPVWVDGRVEGALLLLLDNTAKAQAEATRREFSANVSHELKTPLTTIAGYGEMMQAGLSDEKDTRMLAGKIYGEAKRLLTLIDDIMALSRLDEGVAQETTQPMDAYAIARQVVEQLEPMAQKRQVQLVLEGQPAFVRGVPTLMEEMVRNLVDNAIRYNREGGTVWVRVIQEQNTIKFIVEDNGIGIAKEHLERIFERFYRVDKSRSRDTGGTGLGLSIVKHSAQVQGAEVSLDSEEGKGTRVEVRMEKYLI